jgi:hypothetical protein
MLRAALLLVRDLSLLIMCADTFFLWGGSGSHVAEGPSSGEMRARFCQLEQRYCLISSLCSSYPRSMRLTVGWLGGSPMAIRLFTLAGRTYNSSFSLTEATVVAPGFKMRTGS